MSKFKFKKVDKRATAPTRATLGSVGYDIHALEDNIIYQGDYKTIETGLAFEIPTGYEIQIRPRSSSKRKNLNIILGTVDSDYRGTLKIQVENLTENEAYIYKDKALAQIVFNKVEIPLLSEVEELTDTKRGQGGFGSTDV